MGCSCLGQRKNGDLAFPSLLLLWVMNRDMILTTDTSSDRIRSHVVRKPSAQWQKKDQVFLYTFFLETAWTLGQQKSRPSTAGMKQQTLPLPSGFSSHPSSSILLVKKDRTPEANTASTLLKQDTLLQEKCNITRSSAWDKESLSADSSFSKWSTRQEWDGRQRRGRESICPDTQ